jgi:hypothetical protein
LATKDRQPWPTKRGDAVIFAAVEVQEVVQKEWWLHGPAWKKKGEALNARSGTNIEMPGRVSSLLFCIGCYAGGISMYAKVVGLYYEYDALLLLWRYNFNIGALLAARC